MNVYIKKGKYFIQERPQIKKGHMYYQVLNIAQATDFCTEDLATKFIDEVGLEDCVLVFEQVKYNSRGEWIETRLEEVA